jgi:hypothetical protein
MKTRTTIFDSRISAIADILNAAVNTDVEHQIPERYIGYFCELVVNSMWRSVSNAIAGMELYGDVVGFIFNMGGYIDTMHDIDKVRWHGFSDKQADELDRCYAKVVQIFREIALDIIEMHLRCMVPYDIERSRELRESSESRGTFRNMENISWLCQDAKPTAEEVYNEFLREARKLKHYKE